MTGVLDDRRCCALEPGQRLPSIPLERGAQTADLVAARSVRHGRVEPTGGTAPCPRPP